MKSIHLKAERLLYTFYDKYEGQSRYEKSGALVQYLLQ